MLKSNGARWAGLGGGRVSAWGTSPSLGSADAVPGFPRVVRTRRHAAIVETCLARRTSWIEVITKAVPGLALLISAAKRGAA